MTSRIESVYDWSCNQTTESHKFNLQDYYWTEPIRTACFRLEKIPRALLGIQGLQGTGKSAALKALVKSIPEDKTVIEYKWRRNWEKYYLEEDIPTWDSYWLALWDKFLQNPELIQNKLKISPDTVKYQIDRWKTSKKETPDVDVEAVDLNDLIQKTKSPKVKARDELDKIATIERLENVLGSHTVEEIRRDVLNNFLNQAAYIFIDMPDYNKTNLQLMAKDIDELQHIWHEFMEKGRNTSFLITMQKEIVMRKPHFFFGKIRWVYLEPLTPDQLLQAYLTRWQSIEPFTEEALRLIAKLCRGVFRRFLNYINITIEQFRIAGKSGLITAEDVEAAISFDVLLRDLELELSDIFSNAQQRVQATKILDMLRNANLTQKEIAENLIISEAVVGKLIARLELYNYVKRVRSREGPGWIVSLA